MIERGYVVWRLRWCCNLDPLSLKPSSPLSWTGRWPSHDCTASVRRLRHSLGAWSIYICIVCIWGLAEFCYICRPPFLLISSFFLSVIYSSLCLVYSHNFLCTHFIFLLHTMIFLGLASNVG